MPNATEAQIKTRIAEFVAELDKLVRLSTLEALQGALTNRVAPARRGRPAGSRRGPGRLKGSGNVADAAAKIVAHVKANDGQGIGAIASATGVELKTAKKAAIKLLAEGVLKKSGQRRGTVYHAGGRKPAKKRTTRKAKRATRKPAPKKTTKPRRKVRASKKAVLIPARKRPAAKRTAVTRTAPTTDVPAALAAG